MKKLLIHIRASLKLIILLFIATCLIVGIVAFVYKPIYSVTINGKQVGYSSNKSALQARINNYMETGKDTETQDEAKNVAFVQVDNMPEYQPCLLKKGIQCNDDQIFQDVKDSGTTYYKYFAILDGGEEKEYVSDFDTAEKTVADLKDKASANIDNISIVEKYDSDLKDFVTSDVAVSELYQAPTAAPQAQATPAAMQVNSNTAKNKTVKVAAAGTVNTSLNTSGKNVALGINLARPVSGTITSRFGAKSSIRKSSHTGLDIAAPIGTTYTAAAAGTVTFAGYKGSYGNLIVITHPNGVQTYYGHSSRILVNVGQSVSQGQAIGNVGSTGNSTGPHLHFEVRVNGVAYNPQNYLY